MLSDAHVGRLQQFITQQQYEVGQATAAGHPDCSESDANDNEDNDNDDSETEARTASLGIGYKKTGASASSSLQRFMDE